MNEMTQYEKVDLTMKATKELVELGLVSRRDYAKLLFDVLEHNGTKINREEMTKLMDRKGWE